MEEMGAIPPRFVLEKTLQQIEDFLAKPVTENPLYSSFVEKLSQNDRLREGFKNRWVERVYAAIEEEVLPAYRRLQGFLQGWLQKASDEDGVWRLPNGEDYYAFLLRGHTTTELAPQEVHQMGLDAVDQLTKSVQGILGRMGVPTYDPRAQMQALMKDPQQHFNGDNCREAITRAYQEILDEVNQKMPEIFNYGAMDTILVKRLPEFREPDSPIAYAEEPSLDGNRPGTMWLNLRDPDNIYRWGMRTLAYHEGIPGHVYQMAQAQKLHGLPSFRRHFFYNAYVEGWALYAERLGWELGLEDDLDNLGRLQALLWRAARLVVDTGIHVMRWTRQEAIDYMIAKTGLPERDVITEVERYIVMPGQACAYYIGYQKLSSLRQKAESILAEAFHLKDFHDVIINNGSLPLLLLEDAVNDYIDRVSGLMTGQAE
jgi:uncharacterized protein (DUF885 family)